ncbi:MAG: discoidin domain-containing protein, partial [Microbacterium sp.]
RWAVVKDDRRRADSWIQVDLGEPTEIAEVELGWESAAGREYRIQTSADGEEWHDAASFRYTGDPVTTTDGSWINVEGAAGFVVRGGQNPITVSVEKPGENVLRLGGGDEPFLVEMVPGDAEATQAQGAAAQPSADGLLVSRVDGYLVAFNLSDADVDTTVSVPYEGDEVDLYDGTQSLGAESSDVAVSVAAGDAAVLAPRATVPTAQAQSAGASVTVKDGRTARASSDGDARAAAASGPALDVTNAETGTTRSVAIDADAPEHGATFLGASRFPVPDLALDTLSFPASVLPEGMTSPQGALDADKETSWTPGEDGRMVTDLGAAEDIGSVTALWEDGDAPAATVSVSDDGIDFRDVGSIEAGTTHGSVAVDDAARYVALSTEWSDGDADLAALRVLEPGALDDTAPGEIAGKLPALAVGDDAAATLTSDGFPSPVFSVSSGDLPDGVSLDADTGELSGAPTAHGRFAFTVTAENGIDEPAQREFVWTVKKGASGGDDDDGQGDGDDQGDDDGQGDGGSDGDGQGESGDGQGGDLAVTGVSLGWLIVAAPALLLAGILLRAVRRRGSAGRA